MKINYLEILDLSGNPSEDLIKQRLGEKLNYFNILVKNAPTRHLKMIYEKNIQQLNEIKNNLGIKVDFDEPLVFESSNRDFDKKVSTAILVRHTEDKSTIHFVLKKGINYIGRDKTLSNTDILIDDDDFVSKRHAVLEIESLNPIKAFVYDVGLITGKFSTNGVFLNGMENRISSKSPIAENDTIQVGYTKLTFKTSQSNKIHETVEEVDAMEFTKTVFIKVN